MQDLSATIHFGDFMKPNRSAIKKISFGLLLVAAISNAQASVNNGDFETGTLSNWNTFTTANGALGVGFPSISSFDVAGSGASSSALSLSVGYLTAPCSYPGYDCPRPTEGGGIEQTTTFSGGLTLLHADIAVANAPSLYGGYNMDGGTFSLFLDDALLDSFTVGKINAGTVSRGLLESSSYVAPGAHTFKILVTRQYSSAASSLTQYIDNVSASAVPEPNATQLFGLGVIALVAFWKKRVGQSNA